MRLIDADKLMRFFTVDTANQTYRFGTIKKQIENAETIQAIPIPDNATNGDILKIVFPNIEWEEIHDLKGDKSIGCTNEFWNAPYREEEQ